MLNSVDNFTFVKGSFTTTSSVGALTQVEFEKDPASAKIATQVTFPQEVAFWLDDDLRNFNVLDHEKVFDRDSTVIVGTLPKALQPKVAEFKMWVDTETGVLLGLETKKEDGTPSSSVKVNDTSIETAQIQHREFDTSEPAHYKKMNWRI